MMRWMLIAIGVAAASLVAAAPAGATFPGANGLIAYTGAGGVHTIRPSGQGDRTLGPDGLSATPSWSPDGTRIAFTRTVNFDPLSGGNNEIFSMRSDGTDVRRLTQSPRRDSNPAYSPNGRRIVFTRTGNSAPWVMTMRTDGSDLQRLGKGVAYQYSIGGRWITYYVFLGTTQNPPSIWAMHPNGTDKHRLVSLGRGGGVFNDFAPDGKHFLFTRCGFEACHWLIARMDGSHVHPSACRYVTGYSPDGRWFLGVDKDQFGRKELVRFSVATCRAHVIARNVSKAAAWQSLSP
jgi:hypothetical protein